MKTLTEKRAAELKAQGFTQIAAVVKSIYRTTYYNVNTIDDLLANGGKWIPAGFGQTEKGARGRMGQNGAHIDRSVTARTSAL